MQQNDEWFQARVGKVTASRMKDLMAQTKSGPSASRANYLAQLVVERLTGQPTETYTNGAMAWGVENETNARAAYQFLTDNEVEEVGFIAHPHIDFSGASPDGLIGEDGLLEIKCPNTATHIETLLNPNIADMYNLQIHWQMACTGRTWCDFVSYDPRLPLEMQLKVQRVQRDDALISKLETAVMAFLEELDAKVIKLKELYHG